MTRAKHGRVKQTPARHGRFAAAAPLRNRTCYNGINHGDREGAEEDARDAREECERDKDHDRGKGRAQERHEEIADGLVDGLGAALPFQDFGVNRLDDDDRIVDDKSDGRGDSAERHQIETHPAEPQGHERDEHGDRDHHRGDDGRPPVLEE